MSEPTRFAVVFDGAFYATVPERFNEALFRALLNRDIPADMAATEAEAIRPRQLAKLFKNRCLVRSARLRSR